MGPMALCIGERPHVGSMALLHWKRVPMHFLIMLSI